MNFPPFLWMYEINLVLRSFPLALQTTRVDVEDTSERGSPCHHQESEERKLDYKVPLPALPRR